MQALWKSKGELTHSQLANDLAFLLPKQIHENQCSYLSQVRKQTMKRILRLQFQVALLAVFMAEIGYGEKEDDFHYRLKVRVDPMLHKLEAEAWVQQPPSSRFYLQKSFAIRQVTADGKEVAFHQDSSPDSSMYAKMGIPIVVEARNHRQLHMKYGGELKGGDQ